MNKEDLIMDFKIANKIDEILRSDNIIKELNKILEENKELKDKLKNIEVIIESCYQNTGRNEDNFEYIIGQNDIEKIIDLIPEFLD